MEKAVVHARILCTIAPDKPAYRRVLAECLYNSGQVPAAAEAFRLLLNMPHSPAQHDVNVLLNFARCLHDLGDLDGSHSYFNSVLAQEPSHADAILGIAAVGIAKLRQVSAASTTSAARSPSASSSTGTASSGAGKAGASLEASLQESPHPAPLSSHAPVHRCNTHTHTHTRVRAHIHKHTHTHTGTRGACAHQERSGWRGSSAERSKELRRQPCHGLWSHRRWHFLIKSVPP